MKRKNIAFWWLVGFLALGCFLAGCASLPLASSSYVPSLNAPPPTQASPVVSATPADNMPLEVDLLRAQGEQNLANTRVAELAAAGTATKAVQTATKAAFDDGQTATWAAMVVLNQQAQWTEAAQATLVQATMARMDTQTALPKTETAIAVLAQIEWRATATQAAHENALTNAEMQRPWQILSFLAGLALLVFGYFLYQAWLAHQRETARMQTREARIIHNTLILPSLKGQPEIKRLLSGATDEPLLEPDEFEETQPATVTYTAEGQTTFWNRNPAGEIPGHDAEALAHRQKTLRFLSKAMRVVGQNSNRVPTRDEMDLCAETWTEAVRLLKPYVYTMVGRNGGTYCVSDYPTLRELYLAVGEWQIRLGTVGNGNDNGAVVLPMRTRARAREDESRFPSPTLV